MKQYFLIIGTLLLLGALVGVWFFSEKKNSGVTYYATEQACNEATGLLCVVSVCNYVPEGKTRQQVCKDHPGEAWIPAVEGPY